jgi:hypothetical protein
MSLLSALPAEAKSERTIIARPTHRNVVQFLLIMALLEG